MFRKSVAVASITSLSSYFAYNSLRAPESPLYDYIMPMTHLLPAETSHKLSIYLASKGLGPTDCYDNKLLHCSLFGKNLDSPIGLAAGFDKHAEAVSALFNLGFSTVEIGSVTPLPQEGNAKPRMFRLKEDSSVINRYGFNSQGHQSVKERLETLPPRPANKLLGVNLGKNKTSPADDAHDDYINGIKTLGPLADYIVINISSPNTAGLRNLQSKNPLSSLLSAAVKERNALPNAPPLLVKIAPDVTEAHLKDIASVCLSSKISGVIIGNTTVSRPSSLQSPNAKETGGLSGPPLLSLTPEIVSLFYKLTKGKIPIIGCGGISTGKDAIKYAKAGASVVQLYTALGYKGPGLVQKIKKEIVKELDGKAWESIIGENV